MSMIFKRWIKSLKEKPHVSTWSKEMLISELRNYELLPFNTIQAICTQLSNRGYSKGDIEEIYPHYGSDLDLEKKREEEIRGKEESESRKTKAAEAARKAAEEAQKKKADEDAKKSRKEQKEYSETKKEEKGDAAKVDTPAEVKFAKILDLKGKITKDDIKKKYRDMVHKYHPDKVSHLGDEFKDLADEKFKQINEAYEYFRKRYQIE